MIQDKKVQKILSDLEIGYDLIADKFSSTRAFMWRDLGFINNYVKPGDKVLDFGCGNGRLAGFLKNKYQEFIGVDISQKLIDISRQKYSSGKTEFIKIDSQFKKLPFKNNHFDIIFSIAVFHHFPSPEYAQKVTRELNRVLKPGGKIIISVWNLWQKRFWKYHLAKAKFKFGKKQLGWRELYIPFKSGEKRFHRYHHAFSARELEKILHEAGFEIMKRKKNYNLILVATRTK